MWTITLEINTFLAKHGDDTETMMARSRYTLGGAPNSDPIDPVAAVVPVARVVAIIAVTGDLDDSAATRLLRWCEARLHLLDVGQADIRHLVVDMSRARRASASAVAILEHARTEAARRHVGIHLVGAGLMMALSSAETRRYLGWWSTFPSLDSAHAALEPSVGGDRSPRRPVDPGAILLTAAPLHDRLG